LTGTPGTPTQDTCWVIVHDFVCNDIDEQDESNLKYFKWEIQNGVAANTYNTTPTQGPNITESNVTLVLIEGDGYGFNRSSGTNQVRRLAINVYDAENYSYANNVNVSFWMTNDSSNYRLDLKNQTDILGNTSYYFDPNCSCAVGQQYWIAGVTDGCYVDKNATDTNFTLGINGSLILEYVGWSDDDRLSLWF